MTQRKLPPEELHARAEKRRLLKRLREARREDRRWEDEYWREANYDDKPREPYATTDNEFVYTGEEVEFLKAIDRAKRGKAAFGLVDGFRVAVQMGYRKGLVDRGTHESARGFV